MTLNIIPEPLKIKKGGETAVFSLTRLAELCGGEMSRKARNYFEEFCKNYFELEFVGTGREKILFAEVLDLPPEGYRLTVFENEVKIECSDESGAFWGVQTLIQLLIQNDRSLCELFVEDFPRMNGRGLMLDCASWYFTPEAVKLVLDAMAFHKLNVFHWKLSGDMGWRLELFENLLLSQIGSLRAFTGLGKESHSGYYSQEDVKDILDYAEKRCITVVPELDFPDHTAAAVCAYPAISCFEKETAVPTRFGDTSACLCLGKESVTRFVFSVLDETAQLFKGKYIHIGGEKSSKSKRSVCPHCLEKMKRLGTDEAGLCKSFFADVTAHLEKSAVNTIIRSDEAQLFSKSAVVETSFAVPENGMRTVDAFTNLSLPHGEKSVRECYEHEQSESAIGAEASLNTENAASLKRVGEQLFPRLGAFCENVWTKKESRSFERFLEKLDSYYAFLDLFGFFYTKKKNAFPGKVKGAFEKVRMKLGK